MSSGFNVNCYVYLYKGFAERLAEGVREMEVVVIGNMVKETIFYPDKTVGPVLGSPCAYTSLALARMGKKVGVVTYYGEDFKEEIDRELRLVDTAGCRKYHHTTENHLIYQGEEKNRVEYFKVAPVIDCSLIPEEYLKAPVFFISPMHFEVDPDVCRMLKDRGKTVIVDLGGYGGTTSYNHFSVDTIRGQKLIDALCQCAAIIKASRDDLRYLMPDKSVEACTSYLLARGADCVAVTMGTEGAAYQKRGGDLKRFPCCRAEREEQKNLTGAGDVFAAGMIAALCDDPSDMDYAVRYGNSAASLVLDVKGGCVEKRMPTDGMIKIRMEGGRRR